VPIPGFFVNTQLRVDNLTVAKGFVRDHVRSAGGLQNIDCKLKRLKIGGFGPMVTSMAVPCVFGLVLGDSGDSNVHSIRQSFDSI